MSEFNFIVVGSGIAGISLALRLHEQNNKIKIISQSDLPSSSRVAGGVFNPITGKYLKKAWLADRLFDEIPVFYRKWEERLSAKFFHPTGLLWLFSGDEHKKSALAQIEKYDLYSYIKIIEDSSKYQSHFNSNHGGFFIEKAGWLDMPEFIDKTVDFLKNQISWADEKFIHSELIVQNDYIEYNGAKAKGIIFCEGFYAIDNPYFNRLPFNPAKGDSLIGHISDYPFTEIVNQGKWIVPMGDDKVRLGATYEWEDLTFNPSLEAKDLLMKDSKKLLKVPFLCDHQEAGVRPATQDRRPFLGVHPKFKNIYIFNGFGTKGVSLAPYFSKEMTNFLIKNQEIHPEANIERHYSLYS